MKKFFKNIQNLIIAVLVILILLLSYCNPRTPVDPEVIVKTEIKWDTIREKTPEYIPQPTGNITYETHNHYILPQDIDTAAILRDYYSTYTYNDTVRKDSALIIINDSVSQNKIKSRNVEYELLYPTITITKETILNKREFYLGAGLGATTSNFNYVGVEGLFRSKKKFALGLGIGINNEFKATFRGGLYWKIGK